MSVLSKHVVQFVIGLNIYSSLLYTFPLSEITVFFPNVTLNTIANIFLLCLIPMASFGYIRVVILLVLIGIFLLSFLVNESLHYFNVELLPIRGAVIIFLTCGLLSKYNLVDWFSRQFINLTVCASILVLLQLLSLMLDCGLFFGVNYGTYINFSGDFYTFRVSPLNGDPNYFAYVMLPGMILYSYKLFSPGSGIKKLLVFLFCMLCFVITFSRGILLAFSLSVLFLLLFVFVWNKRTQVKSFFALLLLMLASIVVYHTILVSRAGNNVSSTNQRVEIIQEQLKKINDNVLLGSSYSNSKVVIDNTILGAHNLYIEVASSYGVIVSLSGILFVFILFWGVDIQRRALIIGYTISSLFLGLLIYPSFWMYTCLILVMEKKVVKESI